MNILIVFIIVSLAAFEAVDIVKKDPAPECIPKEKDCEND